MKKQGQDGINKKYTYSCTLKINCIFTTQI